MMNGKFCFFNCWLIWKKIMNVKGLCTSERFAFLCSPGERNRKEAQYNTLFIRNDFKKSIIYYKKLGF